MSEGKPENRENKRKASPKSVADRKEPKNVRSASRNPAPGKEAASTLPPPRRINLKRIEDVRRELGRVYRDMREGAIEPGVGARLTYVLTSLGSMIRDTELEQRIAELERRGAR